MILESVGKQAKWSNSTSPKSAGSRRRKPDEHQKKLIAEKREEYLERGAGEPKNEAGLPKGAQLSTSAAPRPKS